MDFSTADGLLQYKASANTETGLILTLRVRPPPTVPLQGLAWNFQVREQWPQTFRLSWSLRRHSGITPSDPSESLRQSIESMGTD